MLKKLIATIVVMVFYACPALAVNGYDNFNYTKITIIAGDSIDVGEDIGVYIWNERRMAAVEIDSIVTRGDDLELEVTERKTGKSFFFEIAKDDPGIDKLSHFDPGLPYPEILMPNAHLKHNLLDLMGNMMDSGNQIKIDDSVRTKSQLRQGDLTKHDTRIENEHLMYQGFQPVQ